MQDLDIVDVTKKAMRGNRKAVAELCERKAKSIYFTAVGILGDPTDAQDAAQETVLKICRSIGSLKEPSSVESWIMRILRNVCYEMLDKEKHTRNAVDIDEPDIYIVEDDKDVLPERYAIDSEARAELMDAILALPEKRREAIFMFYYDDMNTKQIADITNTNVNTVTATLAKARKMIKNNLMEQERRIERIALGAIAYAPAPATATVLGRALKETATQSFTPEIHAAIKGKWLSALGHTQSSAAAATAVAAHGSFAAHIAIAAAISGVIFASAIYVDVQRETEAYADQTTTSVIRAFGEVDSEISFMGGECDCGHLNPYSAVLTERTAQVAVVKWDVKDASGQTVLSGDGKTITGGLSSLMPGNGRYLLTFYVTDAEGNEYTAERALEVKA